MGLYTVPVSLGDIGSSEARHDVDGLRFIVDTGASHTAIPLELALLMTDGDPIVLDQVGHALTGQFQTELLITERLDFGLGPQTLELAVIDVPYDRTVQASGLLGANAFRNRRVTIDFPASQLHFGRTRTPQVGSHDLWVDDGLIQGTGHVRGLDLPVHVMIDSGATASIVNSAFADEGRPIPTSIAITVLSMAGRLQQSESNRQMFRGFQTSNLCIRQFEVTVADLYVFESLGWADEPAMVIGMDVLQDAIIEIDHATGDAFITGVRHRSCR